MATTTNIGPCGCCGGGGVDVVCTGCPTWTIPETLYVTMSSTCEEFDGVTVELNYVGTDSFPAEVWYGELPFSCGTCLGVVFKVGCYSDGYVIMDVFTTVKGPGLTPDEYPGYYCFRETGYTDDNPIDCSSHGPVSFTRTYTTDDGGNQTPQCCLEVAGNTLTLVVTE